MDIKIRSIKNSNDPNKEIILLNVLNDTNLSGYAIVDSTFANGELSNKFRHIYTFKPKKIKAKEVIALYSGSVNERTTVVNGETVHILAWNSKECIWNDKEGDKVTLIKYEVVDSYTTKKKS